MILLLAGLWLAGCAAPQPPTSLPGWAYANVRLIDPVDAPQAEQDLIAAYAQETQADLDLRLDLLDDSPTPGCDLYLAIDHAPGGRSDLPLEAIAQVAWDTLLVIPAHGELRVLNAALTPRPGAALRVLRDSVQDMLTIRVRLAHAGRDLTVQAFSAAPGSRALADQTAPFGLHAAPPPPAPLLLAFSAAYPAYTPAMALRRWSGAHTGPLGGSHGLGPLLQAAEEAHIPLALLDLKDPASLSALEYAGGLPRIQRLLQNGLLSLPASLPNLPNSGDPGALLSQFTSREAVFGLPAGGFVFAPDRLLPLGRSDSYVLARWSGPLRLAPGAAYLPAAGTSPARGLPPRLAWSTQVLAPPLAMPNGLTREARQWFVEAGMRAAEKQPAGQKAAPLLLGGPLPSSEWGAPLMARQAFAYFNAHPWIYVYGPQDLSQMVRAERAPIAYFLTPAPLPPETKGAARSGQSLSRLPLGDGPGVRGALETALAQAPDNELRRAAWQAYLALYAPVYPADERLPALRANYTRQVWALLNAAAWADAPPTAQRLDCAHDPDRDGLAECILAAADVYLQFEAESGALTFAFWRAHRRAHRAQEDEIHQWIGPSSQLITGLGDPDEWRLDGGLSADPQVILGAFFEPGVTYTPSEQPSGLAFRSADGSIEKRFTWDGAALHVTYLVAAAPPVASLRLPLLLDPWTRFTPGWAARYAVSPGPQAAWRLNGALEVRLEGPLLRLDTFLNSRSLFDHPENPDLDYAPGHYLPFPLAVAALPLHSGVNQWALHVQP